MSDEETEPITAPRPVWMAVLELARSTDMSLAERIASVSIQKADFETKPFLAMQLKLIQGVHRGLEREAVEKLGGGTPDETDIELDLTIAEAMYLHLVVKVADFKGALTLKKNLWRIICALYDREGA